MRLFFYLLHPLFKKKKLRSGDRSFFNINLKPSERGITQKINLQLSFI